MTKMKPILKLFEGWDILLTRNNFHKATLTLTLRYSFLIFILLFVVSILTYAVFMLGLGIPIGDGPLLGVFEEDVLSHETSERLFNILLTVNIIVWFFASVFSYYLAYVTLKPVEDVQKEHEKFVGDVAHELRTPLTVMKSGSQTLLRAERKNEEYKEFISDSLEEVERLIVLSNDLLLLLQQKAIGKIAIESVDFSSLVHSSIQQMQTYTQEKELTMTASVAKDIFIRGNSSDLSRMVTNLLKNAVDYNRTEGSIQVALVQDGTTALLTISDTGIGISKENVAHVFERFYKADTARMQKDHIGSGLGLAIVKEIVDIHEGNINVSSEIGEGTTFSISLPCV